MSILIRRSNLMVPVTNAKFVKGAWRHGADAITLDLEDGVVPALKVRARDLVKDAVAAAGKCAAEVFVRVNKEFLAADIDASVWPGLSGIMLPKVESPEDVIEASEVLNSAERNRGIEPGKLHLIVLLESARAVFRIREIIAASDLVPTNLERMVNNWGLAEENTFADYNEMLKMDEIEAVLVCTPTGVHAPPTVAALQAGKHVLCEKPMEATLAAAASMAQAAHETGKILMVALKLRYTAQVIKAKEIINQQAMIISNDEDRGYFINHVYLHRQIQDALGSSQ